eukprot:647331-Pelagomonas_calceolata.AAC.2
MGPTDVLFDSLLEFYPLARGLLTVLVWLGPLLAAPSIAIMPGLQVDLVHQAAMTAEEVEGLARKLGCKLYRTCVKEDINVTEVSTVMSTNTNKCAEFLQGCVVIMCAECVCINLHTSCKQLCSQDFMHCARNSALHKVTQP